jgi:phosphoenolpyruvate-protein phosphotransferase (PTS system enzyme I)
MSNDKTEVILKGLPASGGIAIGPAFLYEREEVYVTERALSDDEVEHEIALLINAVDRAKIELGKIATFAREKLNDEAAGIFESQIMMLEDVELMRALFRRIRTERRNADFLIHNEIERHKALLANSDDDFFQARVADLDEVGQRLLRSVQMKRLHANVEGQHVIVASQLTPSDTVLFSRDDVLGYATDLGGITSHAAILARSLKIPAVTGLQTVTGMLRTGDPVIIDGQRGLLVINPGEALLREYQEKIRRIEALEASLADLVDLPCVTPDGRKVELSANAEFVNELEYVITQGSKGIGLYRTEHLYLAKGDFPTEQEQYVDYSEIAHIMYPQSVIFRTFDIGGDKLLSGTLNEDNPFLGWRGIRMMLDKRDVFRQQLRAILRASTMRNIKLMFPMISGMLELREVLRRLEEAKMELRNEGRAFDENIDVGVMIEVPSAVFVAEELSREVDFFSIGTNDLVQYLVAVDRNNDLISNLYQEFHPAVLRAVKHTIDTGHRGGIWVGMCGEMAGKPLATTLLLGLGLDEFSMVPSVIPEVKQIIRSTTYEQARELAEHALAFSTSSDVRAFLQADLIKRFPDLSDTVANNNGVVSDQST